MPQRKAAAGISCVFEGTHGADGGAAREKEHSGSIPLGGTMRARGTERILVLVPYPLMGSKRLH
jgi:hypothetical protein